MFRPYISPSLLTTITRRVAKNFLEKLFIKILLLINEIRRMKLIVLVVFIFYIFLFYDQTIINRYKIIFEKNVKIFQCDVHGSSQFDY